MMIDRKEQDFPEFRPECYELRKLKHFQLFFEDGDASGGDGGAGGDGDAGDSAGGDGSGTGGDGGNGGGSDGAGGSMGGDSHGIGGNDSSMGSDAASLANAEANAGLSHSGIGVSSTADVSGLAAAENKAGIPGADSDEVGRAIGMSQGAFAAVDQATSLSQAKAGLMGALGTTQGLANTAKASLSAITSPLSFVADMTDLDQHFSTKSLALADFAFSFVNPITNPVTKAINTKLAAPVAKSVFGATNSVTTAKAAAIGVGILGQVGVSKGLTALGTNSTSNNSSTSTASNNTDNEGMQGVGEAADRYASSVMSSGGNISSEAEKTAEQAMSDYIGQSDWDMSDVAARPEINQDFNVSNSDRQFGNRFAARY